MNTKPLFRGVVFLLLGSLLAGCVSFPATKNISAEAKAGYKRVGVVVLLSDLITTYEMTKEKSLWGSEYENVGKESVLKINEGALDHAIYESASSQFGSNVSVVSIPTTEKEKEIYWEGLEGVSYLARKSDFIARLNQISVQNKLDLIVLVRKYRSRPVPMLNNNEFFGLAQTYSASQDKNGGHYNVLASMVVELLDGKNLNSLDLTRVLDYYDPLPVVKTNFGWDETLMAMYGSSDTAKDIAIRTSGDISKQVGIQVTNALKHLGF
jgi:hypothetical protein